MGTANGIARPGTDVYLLAENRLVREALACVLRKRAGISVVGVKPATDSAIADVAVSGCQVVLTDRLTTFHGANFIQELVEQLQRVKIVLFGMDDDPDTFWQAACLGISGYLLKDASANEIIAAVRGVAQGEAVCPPRLCMTLIQRLAQQTRAAAASGPALAAKLLLTHRQMELVGLVAKGMTNKEIAANLNLSEFTVKNHIHRIMKQVDADSRHEVVEMVRAQQPV
jgi:DNA-binding NarL/FixJ family response regulator